MKKKLFTTILIALFFLAGLSLLLYPFVSNQWNNYRQSKLISSYDAAISEQEASGEIDYSAAKEEAVAYNEALLPSILPDSFAVAAAADEDSEEHQQYMSCLNLLGDGMMGYVQIPKINIKIPIYHTTDEDVLEQAAGHLEGSSLPVGGENTHAVISAHRGLPSASLFTDLDKLEEGDHFLLYILDDILCYEVDQILVVEPDETESLAVQEGQDLVTLLTCTPYGVNSHRLLVRGHRVDYVPEVIEEEEETPLAGISLHTNYLLWVVVGLLVTAVFVFLLAFLDRRKQKAKAAAAAEVPEAAQPEQISDPEPVQELQSSEAEETPSDSQDGPQEPPVTENEETGENESTSKEQT